MNSGEDEPSSGLNGRLRPRKSNIPSPQSTKQSVRKLDGRSQEKPKRSNTPSKASPSKSDDLSNKSDILPTPHLLCPYCDRKFVSKQSISKHVRRLHLSVSKADSSMVCLFCNHGEAEPSDIIRHMVDSHPNQYFACFDCHSRFPSTKELAEHKLNVCEKQKIPYRSKLRQKPAKKSKKSVDINEKEYRNGKNFAEHGFNGIVISCELKPSHIHDDADIEDNITTNLILPPNKNLTTPNALEKNAIIVLDDIQWNKRIPSNFSFHNTDADQILSRLGVVHRSPKTGDSSKKDWFRAIEDATQKFEKCFDTSFYSKVASNVQENLSKFLDGSFNFNPDPDSTIKTRKSKNSVVINTAEGFPILLACEQFSRNTFDGYMPRTIAPKHKWKWDNLENEKNWNTDQIRRDTHANNCIITLVSSLDIWTQLCMRRKYEEKFNNTPVEKKTEKQNMIGKQLKEILESREIPSSKSQIIRHVKDTVPVSSERDFPSSLGLMPSAPKFNIKPAVLSGEWVRPRCYVCCACGVQTRDSRALGVHVSSQHPNSQVQHYEIVGESLLKADILKHLYVPPSQNINRTRLPRGFKDCTKCNKSITIEDLHQHMLDCAGDTPAVRRKCRYRPFGVRRRRPRLPDNRIRKKMRNVIRTRPSRQKNRMRPRPKIRTEVGDAETIRKMLADLPAKRHRVLVNPINSVLRPRKKLDKQRAMLRMKRHTSEDAKNCKSKTINTSNQFDLTNVNDKNKSIQTKDDDNKPLKPRLKNVTRKITRRKESLNRKEILNKPKRKVIPVVEKRGNKNKDKEPEISTDSPKKVQTNELSIDQNEKRINMNSDPQNIREHSSREGSNNGRRDNQRPGCSGQNGNSRNVCTPAQNVPLKHSIARLTANSETHDKSVQFHHLFLVQQECNNEHVPSGQRVLFENEAVVTKLDKPPLHFSQMGPYQGHDIEVDSMHGRIPGHSYESIQGNSIDIQRHTLQAVQKPNLESNQVFTRESTQRPKSGSPKGLNVESVQRYNLESIEGQGLVDARQAPTMETSEGNSYEAVQGQDALQKSKLNKPRKGLNDCIAMLKNKLVDPDPNVTAHVSVQCGSDEPIGPTPALTSVIPLRPPSGDVLLQSSQTFPKSKSKKSSPKSNNIEQLQKSALYQGHNLNAEIYRNITLDRNSLQWNPMVYDVITPRYTDNIGRKEISRRRTSSHTDNLMLAQQLLTAPSNEALIKLSSEIYDTYYMPPQKTSRSRQRNVKNVINVKEASKRKNIDVQISTDQSRRLIENQDKNVNLRSERGRKSIDLREKSIRTRSRSDASRKSSETSEKSRSLRVDPSQNVKDLKDSYQIKEPECIEASKNIANKNLDDRTKCSTLSSSSQSSRLDIDTNMLQFKQIECQPENDINVKSQFKLVECQSEININAEMQFKQVGCRQETYINVEPHSVPQMDCQQEMDMSVNIPNDIYSANFEEDEVSIPPAHASTIVESIVSAPLDLSGKSLPIDSIYSSGEDPLTLASYDGYETLDLSNKSRSIVAPMICEDEVVDLRIKQNLQYSRPLVSKTLTPESPEQHLNVTNVLNLAQRDECVPTDLSIKGKDLCINLSQRSDTEQNMQVQDLSRNRAKLTPDDDQSLLNLQHVPTDLSNRNNTNYALSTSSNAKVAKKNNERTYDFINKDDTPEDLSGKVTDGENTESLAKIRTPEVVVTNSSIQKACEDNNAGVIDPNTQVYFPEDSMDMIQKPVYDPTLRIPQYKIRPSETIVKHVEGNATEVCPLTTTSSAEIYSHPQISLNSIPFPHRAQDSTLSSTPIVASIEAQERITYSFTNSALNVAVTTIAGSIPVYTLLNSGISAPFTTFESTRPVYTLPKACISLTKIDVSKATTFTNSLLSIPSTTIASTTPVYTLAGTTIVTPMNYGTLPNGSHSIPYPPPCGSYLPDIDTQTMMHYASSGPSNMMQEHRTSDMMIRSGIFGFDRNLETSDKNETLPKEVSSILGAMSVDHRNKLLDVLNQYLSTVRPSILNQNSLFFNPKPGTSASKKTSKESTVDASTETVDIKPLHDETTDNSALISKEDKSITDDQVIDLTHDEIVPKPDLDSVEEEEQSEPLLMDEPEPVEEPSVIEDNKDCTVPKVIPQKSNDKTASLRAVRIKAPSERLKSKLTVEPLPNQPVSDDPNVIDDELDNIDTEMLASLDSELSSDIQLYEVSSSQQSNLSGQSLISPNKFTNQTLGKLLKNAKGEIASEQNISKTTSKESKGTLDASLLSPNPLKGSENKDTSLKENNSTKSEDQLQDSLEALNKNQIDIDDDSDDDVSLAIILKQKQQSKKNTSKTKANKIGKSLNKYISQEKLSVNGSRKIKNKEIEKKTDETKANDTNTHFNDIANLNALTTTPEQKSKNNKKKIRRNRRKAAADKEINQNKDDVKKTALKTDINKENDKVLQISNDLQLNEMQSNSKLNDQDKTSAETFTDIPIRKNKEDSQNEDFTSILRNTQTLKSGDATVTFNILNELSKEKNQNKDNKQFDLQENFLNINSGTASEECPKENKILDDPSTYGKIKTDSVEPLLNRELLTLTPNCDTMNINKNISDKDSVSMAVEDTANLKLIPSNAEEIELPLRRSRRGKSLYVEGKEIGSLVNNETASEQKAPLTKKQLIFSKLLLDEENYIKKSAQLDNNVMSGRFENYTYSNTELQTTKNFYNPEPSPLEEKNKSVKRKKSPPPKKKFKKKKSLEENTTKQRLNKESHVNSSSDTEKCNNDRESKINLVENKLVDNYTCEKDKNCLKTSLLPRKPDSDQNNSETIENKTTVFHSTEKRKMTTSITNIDDVDSSKPKKTKLNNVKDLLTLSFRDETNSRFDTNHSVPLAARRTRSKSVVVKSSGSMLYDPYDIELEDMGESTEPFRQRWSLLKKNTSNTLKENQQQGKLKNNYPTTETPDTMLNQPALADNSSKETISDSDESSKSDVPLKKYVEEKERKHSHCLEKNNSKQVNDVKEVDCVDSNIKQSRKKNRKVKKTNPISEDIPITDANTEEETQEQLRSEQFMESFGFFSERKPRKSNLLATKKISETFHSIANESDDIDFEFKERPTKKNFRSENRKIVDDDDISKLSTFSNSPKSALKRLMKLKEESRYCNVCKKEFRRSDNLVRHQMTLLHVSRLSEYEMKIKTAPVPDDPNHLVIFKQHLDRLKMLEYKMKSKKNSKNKFVLPSIQEILADVRKTAQEQQLARRNLSRDEALFLDCCELLKDSNRSQTGLRNLRRPFITCCASSYALACASEAAYANSQSNQTETIDYAALNKFRFAGRPIIYTSAKPEGMPDFFIMSSKSSTSRKSSNAQPSTSTSESVQNSYVLTETTSYNDGDVDSVTAQSILNSEEVRNLENDLISGLKETACKFQPILRDEKVVAETELNNLENCVSDVTAYGQVEVEISAENDVISKTKKRSETKEKKLSDMFENIDIDIFEDKFDKIKRKTELNNLENCVSDVTAYRQVEVEKSAENDVISKTKKRSETKEKKLSDMFENIDIDIFEDKFDKIKRKCRSQAAAAKQVQTVVEQSISHKSRKKSEKKKGKKSSKKNYQNTVLTKGALKGYDSIKVSILTSDIDMSGIAPPIINPSKRKKRSSSKKKKDKKNMEEIYKSDLNHTKDKESLQNVDVYEFMDNEEPEIFGLRPSTIMERFRNIGNKGLHNTSKAETNRQNADVSDTDIDDFVYMSDYHCDDESNDGKKSPSPLKKKEVTEKNAVMDRIFKNNAFRSEKKSEPEEIPKPTKKPASLDQLFDSLLVKEPNSALVEEDKSPGKDDDKGRVEKKRVFTPIQLSKYDLNPPTDTESTTRKNRTPSPTSSIDSVISKRVCSSRESSSQRSQSTSGNDSPFDDAPSTSKKHDGLRCNKNSKDYPFDDAPSTSKKHDGLRCNKNSKDYPFDDAPSTSKKHDGLRCNKNSKDYPFDDAPSTSKKHDGLRCNKNSKDYPFDDAPSTSKKHDGLRCNKNSKDYPFDDAPSTSKKHDGLRCNKDSKDYPFDDAPSTSKKHDGLRCNKNSKDYPFDDAPSTSKKYDGLRCNKNSKDYPFDDAPSTSKKHDGLRCNKNSKDYPFDDAPSTSKKYDGLRCNKNSKDYPFDDAPSTSKKHDGLRCNKNSKDYPFDDAPSTLKKHDGLRCNKDSKDYPPSRSRKYDNVLDSKPSTSKNIVMNDDSDLSAKSDESLYKTYPKLKMAKDKGIPIRKNEKQSISRRSYDYKAEYFDDDVLSDDAGVARQRARRKCTVGKQNVLAETWSSESEPDGIPPRPNSAESVVMSVSRKKKGRKKEGQTTGARKGYNKVSLKKPDTESRVPSSNRNFAASSSIGIEASRPGGSGSSGHALSLPGPSGLAPRVHHPRPSTSFWADGEDEQEHVQQHGWIVGDSHKKLVTMLAHAKGRKRNNDDKRHLME